MRYEDLRVAFDLDDTLLNLKEVIIPYNNEYFGSVVRPEDYCGDWYHTAWGRKYGSQADFESVVDDRWWRGVKQAKIYAEMRAMPGAAEMLGDLQGRGCKMMIITRRSGSLLKDETMAVLERDFAGIDFERIVYLGYERFGSTKGWVARELGVQVLVDNSKHDIDSALEHGLMGVLFGETPDVARVSPNEAYGLYRAKDWVVDFPQVLDRIVSRM